MSDSASLAIVGVSCLFPKADSLQAYWRNIKQGVDAITPIPATHWQAADFFNADPKAPDLTYAQRGGFLLPVDFNPLEYGIAPKDIEATDTTQLLGMVAAKQALADAGYGEKPFNKQRTSVILGVTGALELVIPLGARLGHPLWRRALKEAGVAADVAEDVVQRIADSYVPWQENSFPGLLGNVAAGRIAARLDLGGTNCVVDAACASSMAALHLAALELESGRADMVITGGVDTFNDIFMYMCFSKTPALSPTGDAKPFDKHCDGTILGEGLGMLVLKRLADAERDGDKIYCVLKGIGSSSDGRGGAIYEPRSEGQIEAIQRALAAADATPGTVEMIEAHGTGTKVGDATELRSLTSVFGAARPEGAWVALGSVKSQIGHTKAAAGVAGLIKAALALQHKVLPPTIKVTQPMEEIAPGRSPFYLNTQKRPWLPRDTHPRRAGVSAFGFGGTNFHCVLEEHGAQRPAVGWDADVEILALGAEQLSELRAQLAALPANLPWSEVRTRAHESRRDFRRTAAFRVLLPLTKDHALGPVRDAALTMLDQHPEKSSWSLPSGVCFGSGERRGKLGLLFPGQGSQYVGMFRDLACQFPVVLDALAAADRVFAQEHPELGRQRLSDFIYPHPAFSDDVKRAQDDALKATDIAQPALGAVSLGALGLAEHFGITPEAAAGHSYGELSALCGAGRLQPDSLHRLSNVRGRLMANRPGHADRGAMLAVQAPEETVVEIVSVSGAELVIANRNSPNQFVLAGPKGQIQQAAGEAEKRSLRARVLQVSGAFHSSLVADAREPFAAALEEVAFSKGRIPVYANATAKAYPAGAKPTRDLLASQIVKPVDFIAQIQTMHADGVGTFLELGPGRVLSDLVQSILPGGAVETIALDSSRGSRNGTLDLAIALCRLAAAGQTVDLTKWEDAPVAAKSGKPAFTIPISGANVRAPRPARPPRALAPAPAPAAPIAGIATPPAALPHDLAVALQSAQQGMLSLQKLQEQTAQLHQQFLAGQEAARRTIESLLGQRRELLGLAPAAPAAVRAPCVPELPQPPRTPSLSLHPMRGEAARRAGEGSSDGSAKFDARAVGTNATQSQLVPHRDSAVAIAVLAVVSEKTGYPAEMLTLDMGLDSDLGIDSIKRVEIMAALRTRLPDAPEVKPEHLGSLQTLQQVVDFLSVPERGSASRSPVPVSEASALANTASPVTRSGSQSRAPQAEEAARAVLAVVSEKTGYPAEMLTLDMGLDSDLGIDSIKRVEIMAALRTHLPAAPEVKPEHLGSLQTLQQVVDFLSVPERGSASRSPSPLSEAPALANTASPVTRSGSQSRAPQADEAARAVLAVVSEKTGYPVEMLTLDMGLDSDLGVDSIKRVEIMAALRTHLPSAPEIKPEHLGALQSLRQVVEFLTAAPAQSPPTQRESTPAPSVTPASAPVVAAPLVPLTRQVVRPVRLDANDTRPVIVLPRGALVWITDDGTALSESLAEQLQQRGLNVRRATAAGLFESARGESPSALVVLWPAKGGGDEFLKAAFRLVQAASPSLRAAGRSGGAALVSVSRLDGVFGFGALNGNCDPLSGGLAGLVKTARHEWLEVNCKAVDISPEKPVGPEVAAQLAEEIFRVGPAEVGLSAGARFGLSHELEAVSAKGAASLQRGDLVIVTGGARGITATTALRLARECQPTFVLLGRSQLAESEPAWLAGLAGEAELKRALLAHAEGDRAPKRLEAKFRDVLAQREIREHLAQLCATGATVVYRSADVRDAGQVSAVLAEARAQFGPVRGLIHGAGVLADKRIEDKTAEQFDLVYGTKVGGLRNLLAATAQEDLRLLALFSSFTGRFGRTGQVDYAVANEVLNKIAQVESRRRPQCRVVSFNWGPWSSGMVTDGLRKIFESEGVGLIEPAAGAELFVRDVLAPAGGAVEILALAPTTNLPQPAVRRAPTPVMNSTFTTAFDREVSLRAVPCLASHVMNGRAVLPAALMVEWLAQGALHGQPGLAFHGFDHFQVLKGIVLETGASLHITVQTAKAESHDGGLVVPVQLVSQSGGRAVIHARAEIVLVEHLPAAPAPKFDVRRNGHATASVYGDGRLFHGPDFQSIETLEECTATEIAALVRPAPAPQKWFTQPLRKVWIADPLALDGSFQMMILWSCAARSAPSLPCAIARYRQFAAGFPKAGSRITVRVTAGDSALATADLQFSDRSGKLVALAEGYQCVVDAGLREAFRQNQLPA